MSDKTTSIYIHVPFCVKKCFYCNFYSITNLSLIPSYINCLLKEIEFAKSNKSNEIDTIYFGGGTPSILSIKDIDLIINALVKKFNISPAAEISFEINPDVFDLPQRKVKKKEYLKGLKELGINRLSIGVQSFNTKKLKFLQRMHNFKQAMGTINEAFDQNFKNINIDLIYALPIETKKGLRKDLNKALDFAPSHLSCYMLVQEKNTCFDMKIKSKQIKAIKRLKAVKFFKFVSTFLENAGYEHYETSSFAKNSKTFSKHNLKYWDTALSYKGFGPGAHSYDTKTRYYNHADLKKYIQCIEKDKVAVKAWENLSYKQKMLEMIMLNLRTKKGINIKRFNDLFDIKFEKLFGEIVKNLQSTSFGNIENQRFFLNLKGMSYLDNIVESFAKRII